MTTMAKHETEIIVDKDLPLVRIIREFDAPPEKVFRAHTDPELFVKWQGPHGLESTIDVWDCRTGGSWRYVSVADGVEHGFHGSYHEVRPSEVIVQTFSYEGFPDSVSLERLELQPLDGGTRTRLVATSLVDSFEGRDAFVASGMETGVVQGYERLDRILAS